MRVTQLLAVKLDLTSGPLDFKSETSFFCGTQPPKSGLLDTGHPYSWLPSSLLRAAHTLPTEGLRGGKTHFLQRVALLCKGGGFARGCDTRGDRDFRALPSWSTRTFCLDTYR